MKTFLLTFLLAAAVVRTVAYDLSFEWNANTDSKTTNYFFYTMSGGSVLTRTDVGLVTTYTRPNLSTGVTYEFYVTAGGTNSTESLPSNRITYFLAVPPVLVPPTVIQATRSSASPTTASTVSWNVQFSQGVSGVDLADFSLALGTGLSGSVLLSVSGTSGGSNYVVNANSGLGAGTLLLSVLNNGSVQNATNNAALSAGFTGQAYTIARALPAQIVGLNGTPVNFASISWTFSSVSGATSYILQDTNGVVKGSGMFSPIVESGLSQNVLHTRRVIAQNPFGSGAASTNGSAYSGVAPAASVTLSSISSNSVVVSWTQPVNVASGLTGTELSRSLDNVTWTTVSAFSKSAGPYTNVSLQPSTTYFYRVNQRNGDGFTSGYSVVRSTTTLGLKPPTVTGFIVTSATNSGGLLNFGVSWNAVSGFNVTNYHVAYSGPASGSSDVGLLTAFSALSLPLGVYLVSVTADNAAGRGPSTSMNVAAASGSSTPPSRPRWWHWWR